MLKLSWYHCLAQEAICRRKCFLCCFRVKVLLHAIRENLSLGGVLFYCDPNSYEDKGKFGRSGARPIAGGLGTVRVVLGLD